MSAKHALLGLLLDRPAYPYQLADQLKLRLGPAWKVNSGQLYQTIKALEKDGLIERVHETSPDHEHRHVFEITDEGVVEFERFFDQSSDAVRLCRRPLLVKITFAGPQRLEEALTKVDAYERECVERLAETARLREELPADGSLLRADHLLLRLNLSADIFQLEGELRWAAHAREILSWLADQEAVWPGERERSDADVEGRRRDRGNARRELFGRIAGSERGDGGTRPSEQDMRPEQ
ncbi:MAG TPA: PadR family transcriptional regulator [Solirubrobacteraceae bacterium]|jgi:DNA-binding PadR family transcriptional regulator|nr:PadR family transcriptional regulator [Solirubrobacteraceae bacterium]